MLNKHSESGQQALQRSKKSIALEKEIETKVRKTQARLIERTDQNWSLSSVLNLLVSAGLQQTKKMTRNKLADAFPKTRIRAFAVMRTISTPEDFTRIIDPCRGTISLVGSETFRDP